MKIPAYVNRETKQKILVSSMNVNDGDITNQFKEFINYKEIEFYEANIDCDSWSDSVRLNSYRMETDEEFQNRKAALTKRWKDDEKMKCEAAKKRKIQKEENDRAEFERLKKKFEK